MKLDQLFLAFVLLTSNTVYAGEFTLFTYGKPSNVTSSSIRTLIVNLIEKKVIEKKKYRSGMALFQAGSYVLMDQYRTTGLDELLVDVRKLEGSASEVTFLETSKSMMVFSPPISERMREEILKDSVQSENRYWSDLKFGKAKTSALGNDQVVFINRPEWEIDKNWHTVSYEFTEVSFEGQNYRVYNFPKHFGSYSRVYHFLNEKTSDVKNKLLVSTGNIVGPKDKSTKVRFTELSSFGENLVVAGVRDILHFERHFKDGKSLYPKMKFTSANVFVEKSGKKEHFFPPYVVTERGGIKIGVIGITDQHAQKVIEYHSLVNPALKNISIADPMESLWDKLLLELRKKVDIVILLSDLREEELGAIEHKLWLVDVVVARGRRLYSGNKDLDLKVEPFLQRNPVMPIATMYNSKTNINYATFNLEPNHLKVKIRGRTLDQKTAFEESVDHVDDDYVRVYTRTDVVLPDHQKVFPRDKNQNVKDAEFGMVSAEMLRRAARAEVGIFNIQDANSDIGGDLSSSIVRAKIRGTERMVTFYLSGRSIKATMGSLGGLKEPYTLAVSGVTDGMINGIPVKDDEMYLVSSSTAVTENLEHYPFMGSLSKKNLLFPDNDGKTKFVADVVIDQLRKNWKSLENVSEKERIESFRSIYLGQVKNPESYWLHSFKSIRLEYSNLNTGDVSAFSDVIDSQIQSADQESVGGKVEYSALYRSNPYVLELGVRGEFSKVRIFPEGEELVENTLSDDLVIFSEIGFPVFKVSGAENWASKMGPFFEIEYDTEFETEDGQPKESVYRGTTGWKFFDGKLLQSLDIGAFGEFQRTEGREKEVTGVSLNFDWAMAFFEGRMKWRSNGDFKYFFDTTSDTSSDLKTRYAWDNYFDFSLLKGFSMGPYFRLFSFSGKTFDERATQTTVGISLSYGGQWKPAFQDHPM